MGAQLGSSEAFGSGCAHGLLGKEEEKKKKKKKNSPRGV